MSDPSKQAFLNTLFQWTVKNSKTDSEFQTDQASVQPMKDEDKQWLNEALENITVNPVERMKLCINQIKSDEINQLGKREFLEELCHWVEELDLAKDFFTIDGLQIVTPLLDHSDNVLRQGACRLIANLVQNNDHCQRIIVQSGLQQKLLKILDESDDAELKTAAVTAISALVRGYTLGQLQLQKYQGIKILIRALSTPIPRLQRKLCFLINTICSGSSQMRKVFFENGAQTELIRLANDPSCPEYCYVLRTILTITNAKENSLQTLAENDPTLIEQFETILIQRRQEILHLEDHQDDVQTMNEMRDRLRLPSTQIDSAPSTPTTEKPLMLALSTS